MFLQNLEGITPRNSANHLICSAVKFMSKNPILILWIPSQTETTVFNLCLLSLSFGSLFFCFLISLILSFASSFLASHCWEVIALSVSLMNFKSFFKFPITSFVEEVALSSLVFVYIISFCLMTSFYCYFSLSSIAFIYFKVWLSPSKKISFHLLQWQQLFHLKSSFRSEDL